MSVVHYHSAVALRQLAEVEQKATMFYVYAIYNRKNNKIYIGQSQNLDRRLEAHGEKRFVNAYTARFDGMWELIYKEKVDNRKDALLREKQLKSYRGREFIKSNIPR